MKKECILCSHKSEFIYSLKNYRILQCQGCKTCFVEEMPTNEELKEFYNGFKYCINEENKKLIINKKFEKWFKSFNLPQNAKMLDIGGGNGYFSLAFETFGIGKATYIDLDPTACKYVETLGINRVINDDVKNLANHSNEKYDFIYSRHVIEHLPNPLVLIDEPIKLLSDDGVFVLQLPNGMSLERLTDFNHKKQRIGMLRESNNFTEKEIEKILHSSKTAFDLVPPRHLWAFSIKGLKEYLSKNDSIEFEITTESIMDEVYSPFMGQQRFSNFKLKKVIKPIKDFMRTIFSIPYGRAHIVVKIKKRK